MSEPNENPDSSQKAVANDALFGFLRGKLADAEKSLKSREDMANQKPISKEDWEWLKSLPGTIACKGRKPSKAKQEEEIMRHKRIAVKCRREVEMFKAVIAKIECLQTALEGIEEIYIDGCDTYEDWRKMGDIARSAIYQPNS
jgi:hypothetical protein